MFATYLFVIKLYKYIILVRDNNIPAGSLIISVVAAGYDDRCDGWTFIPEVRLWAASVGACACPPTHDTTDTDPPLAHHTLSTYTSTTTHSHTTHPLQHKRNKSLDLLTQQTVLTPSYTVMKRNVKLIVPTFKITALNKQLKTNGETSQLL